MLYKVSVCSQYAGPHEVSLLTNSHAGRGWSGEAVAVAVRQRVSLRRAGAAASCFAPGVCCSSRPRYFAPVFCGSSAAVIGAVLSGRARTVLSREADRAAVMFCCDGGMRWFSWFGVRVSVCAI